MEWDASSAEEDADDDMFVRFDEPNKDLNAILHPIGGAQQELRYFVIQALQHHIARHVHRILVVAQWNEMERSGCPILGPDHPPDMGELRACPLLEVVVQAGSAANKT